MSTNNLQDLGKRLSDIHVEVEKNAKTAIAEAVKEYFSKHSKATAVRWTQYIPGFNDGAPCTFSLGSFYIQTDEKFTEEEAEENGIEDDEAFISLDECSNGDGTYTRGLDKDMVDDASELFDSISGLSDVLGNLFGECAEITVLRDSDEFNVEYYDCGW